MADTPLMVVAAAALVDADGRVLVQQRPPGAALAGLWEFPGGKLEPGESPQAALARELAEELAIRVEAADLTPLTFATGTAGERPLLLLLFHTVRWSGMPTALAATALRWVRAAEMVGLPMPPADRPLVTALAEMMA